MTAQRTTSLTSVTSSTMTPENECFDVGMKLSPPPPPRPHKRPMMPKSFPDQAIPTDLYIPLLKEDTCEIPSLTEENTPQENVFCTPKRRQSHETFPQARFTLKRRRRSHQDDVTSTRTMLVPRPHDWNDHAERNLMPFLDQEWHQVLPTTPPKAESRDDVSTPRRSNRRPHKSKSCFARLAFRPTSSSGGTDLDTSFVATLF